MTGGSHKSKIGVVLGTSIAGVIGLLFLGCILLYCKGQKKGHRPEVFVDVPGEKVSLSSLVFLYISKISWIFGTWSSALKNNMSTL